MQVMPEHRYTEALRRVAPHLAQHPSGGDVLRILADWERHSCSERLACEFDTAEAVYYLAMLNHGGQWCPLYSALCATDFSPGPCWRRPERHSTAAAIVAEILRTVGRNLA